MNKRKPLDLKQKWFVAQYWTKQKPQLTRAGSAVLIRLLDRQNPKTGRCDPSAVGLAEETGFSVRSVRGAFKELEGRGAIKRFQKTRCSRNQFLIYSVEELGQTARLTELKMRAGERTGLKPVSAPPATHCRADLKRASPETIKETKKKKETAEKRKPRGSGSCLEKKTFSTDEMTAGQFENRAAKVFEKEGYGYEGLVALPADEVELAFNRMVSGELSFSRAVGSLLNKFRSLGE